MCEIQEALWMRNFMNTISSRMKRILLCTSAFYIMDSILFLPVKAGMLKILVFMIYRFGIFTVMFLAVKLWVVRQMEKTEKAADAYISGKITLEQLCGECPFTPAYDRLLQYLRTTDSKKEMLRYSVEQSKLIALQNQINPHFLYNTLDAIRGDALEADLLEIASITEALASFFHYSISDLDHLTTLDQEVENVKEYFKIQQFRFGKNLKLKIDSEETLTTLFHYCIPRMTLQPLVENAISHGLECKEKKGTVSIHIVRSQYELIIKVLDDGVGMEKEEVDCINEMLHNPNAHHLRKEGRGGIALANISSRIRLIFGIEYGITVFSCKHIGTTVQINLPLVERNEWNEEGITANREWNVSSK